MANNRYKKNKMNNILKRTLIEKKKSEVTKFLLDFCWKRNNTI